jgi:anthranilate phosphoribosyltransferase
MDKKFQKKKDRERQVKKKILEKRMSLRAKEKEKRQILLGEQMLNPKRKPINRAEFLTAKAIKEEEIKKQLLHNMEVLKALEAESNQSNPKPVEPHMITPWQAGPTAMTNVISMNSKKSPE